jgi:hypothetical protein
LAQTRRTKPKSAAENGAVTTAEPPPINPQDTPPEQNQRVQPLKSKQLTFFEQMSKINTADWGTRAKVTLYRLEPLIDQLRAGNVKYINVYHEPVDEQRIKLDYGSGRYRLMLTFAKPGLSKSDTVDAIEFDILDQSYPPKIPEGTWIDDPRNTKWNWAKRFFKGADGDKPPARDILDDLDKLDQIQDRAAQRLRDATPPQAIQPATPPSVDPIETAGRIIAMTQGGGQTVLMEMFREELRAMREDNRVLQQEARARAQAPVPPVPPPADPLDMLSANLEKFEKIKNVLAPKQSDSVISPNMRSKMSGWQEFAVNIAEKAFESPVIGNLLGLFAQGMFNRAQAPNGTAAPIPQQLTSAGVMPNPAAPPNQMQQVIDFLNTIATPMLNMFGDDMDGGDFAEWLYEGHGDTWIHPSGQSVQWYVGAKQIGAPNLLQFFQRSPYWVKLQPQAEKFTKFLNEFVAWEIPKEPEADAAPEVIEFEGNAI